MPDKYGREGYHEMNLINGLWNGCFVEITELPGDKVTKLSFAIEVFGKERTMGDSLKFDIDAVALETIENPEVLSDWQPAPNRIIFSTTDMLRFTYLPAKLLLYSALPGETVGAIPAGMQPNFNENTPYWPQFNTATYKEVWNFSATKWLSLIAEF
ncbi:hypothetical protein [Maribellus sp. YY47]|uniref:hypothetical protein n=1 Tax=Maribellus sp. YY47 TaxID=2929486 RepID=UPI00200111F0|nr:hypothetical protein [Maribellus sp. YY47]MCK3685140.1 hypothetical protein [Maribellus sp. YY47]